MTASGGAARGYSVKFKLIFTLFNIVIVVSFVIIFFMPLAMLGWDYTREFWSRNWGLPLVFVGILAVLNSYFIINWKLFHLLEQEDWEGLKSHLEEKIYTGGSAAGQHLRILTNSYLVTNDVAKIRRLEDHLRVKKPELVRRHALIFGIPYLIEGTTVEAEAFFAEFADSATPDGRWHAWNLAFVMSLGDKRSEGCAVLIDLLDSMTGIKRDPVLYLLTLYRLQFCADQDEAAARAIDRGISAFREAISKASWERAVENAKNQVHVAILSRKIDDAADWFWTTVSVKNEG